MDCIDCIDAWENRVGESTLRVLGMGGSSFCTETWENRVGESTFSVLDSGFNLGASNLGGWSTTRGEGRGDGGCGVYVRGCNMYMSPWSSSFSSVVSTVVSSRGIGCVETRLGFRAGGAITGAGSSSRVNFSSRGSCWFDCGLAISIGSSSNGIANEKYESDCAVLIELSRRDIRGGVFGSLGAGGELGMLGGEAGGVAMEDASDILDILDICLGETWGC